MREVYAVRIKGERLLHGRDDFFIPFLPVRIKQTDSLRSMEADGIITRAEIESEPPKVVEYALSPLGMTLRPILSAMKEWGEFYKTQE